MNRAKLCATNVLNTMTVTVTHRPAVESLPRETSGGAIDIAAVLPLDGPKAIPTIHAFAHRVVCCDERFLELLPGVAIVHVFGERGALFRHRRAADLQHILGVHLAGV